MKRSWGLVVDLKHSWLSPSHSGEVEDALEQ